MSDNRRRRQLALVLSLMLLVLLLNPLSGISKPRSAVNPDSGVLDELDAEERAGGRYYTIVDEQGRTVTITGRRVRAGDRYLASDNRLYEVRAVDGYTARARYLRTEQLPSVRAAGAAVWRAVQAQPNRLVALYHTHNAESYIPTDGSDSVEGRGGIHEVGDAFAAAMRAKGIDVIHDETMHTPHDLGAYRRSRETVLRLLEVDPDVIFDIHRDAAPPEAYAEQIDSTWVTQIQFVVGNQNPNLAVSQQFAYDLKGYADSLYPGLVKGVFVGQGDFNQDLTPLNLLLEVGAHTNSRPPAEEGAALFSDVVAYYFYGPEVLDDAAPQDKRPGAPSERAGVAVSALWGILLLLTIVLAGALAFYLLNNPGGWAQLPAALRDVPAQLRRFMRDVPARLRRAWQRLLAELPQERAYLHERRRRWRRQQQERRRTWGENLQEALYTLGEDAADLAEQVRRWLSRRQRLR